MDKVEIAKCKHEWGKVWTSLGHLEACRMCGQVNLGEEECQHTEGFDHWVCNACGEQLDPPDLDYGDD